jgi:glycosyltransferase involved in cell wall biosynthesis
MPIHICIDARLLTGTLGGVEQFVIGLADGLSRLPDGDEEYSFLAYADNDEWLRPYIGGASRIIHGTAATRQPKWSTALQNFPGAKAVRDALGQILTYRMATSLPLPRSDGFVEQSGFDLIHFPTQNAFLTSVPSIYQPWDLQHLHLPQYFAPEEFRWRESSYRAYCAQASMVAVTSIWQKRDVMGKYDLTPEKVQVVPGAPVISAYPVPTENDLRDAREKFALPESFIFYPAQTFAHKNHVGLFHALKIIRERHGVIVRFVSSGNFTEFYSEIKAKAEALGVADQLQFLGFVSTMELQSLYRLSRLVVFPTQFEGLGMPLLEAFQADVPCACSNVTSLPELAGDAALIFDPADPEEMANVILQLWNDATLRAELVAKGKHRIAHFSWDRTARLFRAHYRRLSDHNFSQADAELIASESSK